MTTYIVLFSLTDAGIKATKKDSPRRLDAASERQGLGIQAERGNF